MEIIIILGHTIMAHLNLTGGMFLIKCFFLHLSFQESQINYD